jgi:iron complex outermembrane receptor protein
MSGARHEWLRHQPKDDPRGRAPYKGTATSFSGAVVWEVLSDNYLTVSATHSDRLPHAQELYARGIHLATNAFECGLLPHAQTCGGVASDAPLQDETSTSIEFSWRRTAGSLTFALNGYVNDVDNYIHARTLDQFEDFRLIKYSQRDARFRGMEAEVTWELTPAVSATAFGDLVRARFDGGGNLPRIPASRYGARVEGSFGRLGGELEFYRVNAQERIAEYETPTPGHDMLSILLRYGPATGSGPELFVRGSNLLDEAVWNHSSYLADAVPLPGRSVSMGMSWRF